MYPGMEQYGGGAPDLSLMQMAVYGTVIMILVIFILAVLACSTLPIFFGAMWSMSLGLRILQNFPDPVGKYCKLGGLVFRSLRRNLLRTALTYVALFVLTGMLTAIYGLVTSIGNLTAEKEDSQLVIMTDKFGIPSQLKPAYADKLKGVMQDMPESNQPRPLTDEQRVAKGVEASPIGPITKAELDRLFRDDLTKDESSPDRKRFRALAAEGVQENFMTWSFVVGSLDPTKFTQENNMFLFCLDPTAVKSGMMAEQGLSKEDLGDEGWAELLRTVDLVKQDKRHIIVGEDRLKIMNKKIGDDIKLYCLNYKDLTFECKIVGSFPAGSRMANNSAMQYEYLQAKLNEYERTKGTAHPQADRCLNLVWVRMPNKASYQALAEKVNDRSLFNSPATKMETFSAVIGSFLEPYKDIFWGLKYIIMPAIVVIMCLVIGITITIGVRERWTEMAVMKVLGFQPWQIMAMIVSEAMLIGVFGGLLSTWAVYFGPVAARWVMHAVGGKSAFLEGFKSPIEIVFYGPLLGIAVGLIGSALPSWNARKVKVSEVFAQVA